MLTLNRIESNWSRQEREKLNNNWTILETSYINVLNTSALAKEVADAAKEQATNAVNIANNATTLVNNIKKQFDQIIANQNTSNTEVVAARTDRNTSITYTNLGSRLDAINKYAMDHSNDNTRHVNINNELLPSSDISALSNGIHYSSITIDTSNPSVAYTSWRDQVREFLGIETTSLVRIMIETLKNNGINKQVLYVFSGTSGTSLNTKLFEMSRFSTRNNTWSSWRIEFTTLYNNGNPEGSVSGIKGMKCIDMLTGDEYFKKTSDLITTNTGWIKIGGTA